MPKSIAKTNQEIAYKLSNNLARLLKEFGKDFELRVLSTLRERGHEEIRPSHSAVFSNLGMGAVRVTELAERAQVTQQAMGKMLKELERIGYVARDVDGVDRRAREIRLTEKGVKLVEETMIVVDQVRLEYAAKIGAHELDQLEDLLRRAVNKIELTYLPESWVEQKY
jgi:DNA-binding MarR family transcriptional regulator